MAKQKSRSSLKSNYDVIIVGGGPAGLTMAALLGNSQLSVLLLERESENNLAAANYDGRTTALAFGSSEILSRCGVWKNIEPHACPIDTIRVADQHAPMKLDFSSGQNGQSPFGYVVDNAYLRRALFAAVKLCKNIALACEQNIKTIHETVNAITITTEKGKIYSAALLVAADGRQSLCRSHAGIQTRNWSYNETALVCTLKHSKPHHNQAIENFFPNGPFAVLPMTDNRSGVVWTEKPETAQTLQQISEGDFIAILKNRGGDALGDISLATERRLYPLHFMLADELFKGRTVLIGEAAHGMHPIAGQGLNLSVRDAAVLADLITANDSADSGAKDLLHNYSSRRHLDHFTFMSATDVLVKLFSNNLPPIRWARQLGLGMVQRLPFAKRFFSHMAMGILR